MWFAKLFVFLLPLSLFSQQPSNLLLGSQVQVNSEISPYEVIKPGEKIQGTIMVTHNKKAAVDGNSFTLDGKPVKAELMENTLLGSNQGLEISIYRFEINGMSTGVHILKPIKVKVGGEEYAAPPLTVVVGQ